MKEGVPDICMIITVQETWEEDSTSLLQGHKGFTQSLKLRLNLC